MKDTQKQSATQSCRKRALITKIGLALVFVLGVVLIYAGNWGKTAIVDMGFVSESENGVTMPDSAGFDAVYSLSNVVDDVWEKTLRPELSALPSEERGALDQVVEDLLVNEWENKKAGGGDQALAILDDASGENRSELAFKLLYATYLSGKRISGEGAMAREVTIVKPSNRDAITALPEEDMTAFRLTLLRCAIDEEAEAPEQVQKSAAKQTGQDRQAVMIQAFFISTGSQSEKVSDMSSKLSKAFQADPEFRLKAFCMIARQEITWGKQYIVHHAQTIMLIGILLAVDVLLLAFLMFRERNWAVSVKWIVILLIVDFLLYFLLMPMVYMVIQAFSVDGTFSLERITRLYENADNWKALTNTLIAAGVTMVLGTLIAFPLAWLVGRTNLYGKRFFRMLFVMSYMVPPYVGAMAWTHLLNPNAGPVNHVLRTIFAMGDVPGPLNIYTLPGLIWVLTAFYFPYAFITISRAMEKMDPTLEEASRVAGGTPFKTVMKVTLPMMTPSLIAGALLVFISAASCYGIPSIIANGSSGLETATTRIKTIAERSQESMGDATGLAVFLMAVAMIILILSDGVLARKQYTTVSGKSVYPAVVDLRKWRIPLTVIMWIFALIVIFLPFGAILSISIRSDLGKGVFEAGNFTLANWSMAFTDGQILACVRNSAIFALIAATVGIVIACVMSYLLQRTTIRGRSIPNFLITLGSGTPSVVIALGLIMTMKGNMGLALVGTPVIMVVAYLVKYLMMGMRTVVSSMSQIHVSLEESSQISGASWLRTMLRITGPLILPSIAAGWFLIFIPCFYELSMSALLSSATTTSVGEKLFEYWTFTSKPVSCALAFGILMMVVLLNLILNRLTKGKFSI